MGDEVPEALLLRDHFGEVHLIVRKQKAENEVLSGRLAHSEAELQFMREEVLKLTANVDFLREENAGLHEEFGRHKVAHEVQIDKFAEEHGEWERTVTELQGQRESENEQLKNTLESEKSRTQDITKERDRALQREQEMAAMLQTLEEGNVRGLQRERELTAQHQRLEQEKDSYVKHLQEAKTMHDDALGKLRQLTSAKAEMVQENAGMVQEKARLEQLFISEKDKIVQEKANLEHELAEIKVQVSRYCDVSMSTCNCDRPEPLPCIRWKAKCADLEERSRGTVHIDSLKAVEYERDKFKQKAKEFGKQWGACICTGLELKNDAYRSFTCVSRHQNTSSEGIKSTPRS